VNTYFTAAGEPVSERLVPEPYTFDESAFPPSPTGSPPRSFVPSDDGRPKYLAYVPKDADPGFDSLAAEEAVSVSVHRVDERKKEETEKRYKRMAEGEKPKKSYLNKEAPKKRKLDETDSSDDLPGESAPPPSRKKAMPKRRKAASKDKENVELQAEH
jgi:hypothetical protein